MNEKAQLLLDFFDKLRAGGFASGPVLLFGWPGAPMAPGRQTPPPPRGIVPAPTRDGAGGIA